MSVNLVSGEDFLHGMQMTAFLLYLHVTFLPCVGRKEEEQNEEKDEEEKGSRTVKRIERARARARERDIPHSSLFSLLLMTLIFIWFRSLSYDLI